MKKHAWRLIEGIVLATLLAAAGFALYSFHAYQTSIIAADTTVVIAPHTRTRDMLAQLHEAQVLPAPATILIPIFARQQYRGFKAGEYIFSAGTVPRDVLEKIARGEVVIHKVTIPEGFTSAQVTTLLTNEPLLSGTAPVLAEGSVFPNTYQFTRGDDRAAFAGKITRAMTTLLDKEWATRAPGLPLTTEAQALILASIIERETGVPNERPMVAAVYINRLNKGMKLQADPTVAYGIDPAGPMNRPLSASDLAHDTPYNTYVREGLPPTPICNPGAASISAALHPATSDALYFVATGSGGHNFAATEAEHLKNVAAYRAAIGEVPAKPVAAKKVPAKKSHKRKK